jgi:hypothetical protein
LNRCHRRSCARELPQRGRYLTVVKSALKSRANAPLRPICSPLVRCTQAKKAQSL